MTSFDVSLQGVHTFLSTHAGRDQVGKFVNYSTRGAVGVLADMVAKLSKDDPQRKVLEEWRVFLRKIMVSVGDARRTVRWFSGLGIVLALRKLYEKGEAPWDNKVAFAVAQLSLLWWHAWDHYRWCVATQLVQGDQTRIKNVSFTGFVVSSGVSTMYFAHKLFSPPPGLLVDKDKEAEHKRGLAKSFLTLIATLHISELYMTHEAVCGAAGALTSAIVMYETFPKVKKAV